MEQIQVEIEMGIMMGKSDNLELTITHQIPVLPSKINGHIIELLREMREKGCKMFLEAVAIDNFSPYIFITVIADGLVISGGLITANAQPNLLSIKAAEKSVIAQLESFSEIFRGQLSTAVLCSAKFENLEIL